MRQKLAATERLAIIVLRCLGFMYAFLGLMKLQALVFPDAYAKAYMALPNPLFEFVPNLLVLTAGALVEAIVGGYLVVGRRPLSVLAGLQMWLVAVVACYKFALALIGYSGPCGCLLGINRLLPIPIAAQKHASDAILVCSILISGGILFFCIKAPQGRCGESPEPSE